MLSDRPYMRDDYRRERTSFLIWLLSAIIAGFIIQTVLERLNLPAFEQVMAFSVGALQSGYIWTLVTYPLLHDNILHVLMVGLSLFFIGRELTNHVGERRMMWLALGATVAAALTWLALALSFGRGGGVIGATPILLCYFTVFACLFPNREISFLIFFVLPVTTRPKYLLWGLLGIELFGFVFNEIPGGRFLTNVPHSAHLGAMLAGWIYYRFLHEGNWLALRGSRELDFPAWMKRARKPATTPPPVPQPATASRTDIRAEVDRILDKINSHGFGALTPEEKRKLDDAKDILSRR